MIGSFLRTKVHLVTKLSKIHPSVLIAASVLILASWYLAIWRHMPIYPDETSMRLQNARAIVDNWVIYPPFAQCIAGITTVPYALRPFAYLLSAFDLHFQWSLVRSIPILATVGVFSFALFLILRHGANVAAFILPLAIIGVAPSSIIMTRYEIFLIFQIAACLAFYASLTSPRKAVTDLVVLFGFTFFTLLSDNAHPQALVFFPATILLMITFIWSATSRKVAASGVIALIWICFGTYDSLAPLQRKCADFTGPNELVSNQLVFGAREFVKFSSGIQPWLDRLHVYISHFTYNIAYSVNYLPGVDLSVPAAIPIRMLNICIAAAVVFNLLCALTVSVVAANKSANLLLFGEGSWREDIREFSVSGATLLALTGFAHIAFLIVVTSDAYYRSHYINFALAVINALGLSSLTVRRQMYLVPICIGLACVSVEARLLNSSFFDEKFREGWSGPSLSVLTNWPAIHNRVNRLADSCGIAKKQSGIIVDDRTFSALREHPHLIAFTYLSWGHSLDKASKSSLIQAARQYGSAILVHCANFGSTVPEEMKIDGDYCCANF
jgi:hypothetical protein